MASNKKRLPESVEIEAASSKRRNISQDLSQYENLHFRSGKIIRLHLTNFMCHSNLVINLSGRVNFFLGSNGSGKSAVLAALVIGLGAKASATNRSQNIKKFIKTDESFANIEIEIANSAPDAFNFETYGHKIVINRHITRTSSCYRIKNANGDLISKKADDLQKIMLYHNIQVENPVFVLNQENTRIFLKDLDPVKNYQLFIKATQIEMIGEKLNDCLRSSKLQTLQLNCLAQTISYGKEEINELKQRLAQLDSLRRVKELLKKFELERLWVLFKEEEKKLDTINLALKELMERKLEFENKLQNKDSFEGDCRNALSEIEKKIEEKQILYTNENLKVNSIKTKLANINDVFNEIDASIENTNKKNNLVKIQIEKLQEYIAEKVSNNRVSVQDLRVKNEKELNLLKHNKAKVLTMFETTKHDINILIENKCQIEQKLDDLRKNKRRLCEETCHIQSEIDTINVNSKDALWIYGEDVSHIISIINKLYQEKKFSELPRGPLGRYIEVVAKFRDAIENQLGGLIQSFIVSNNKDYMVLEHVLKSYPKFNPTIITTKFMNKPYDVSKGKVHSPRGTTLIMDQIRCSDPVVLNCLIDRGSIETILLTENKEVAEYYTSNVKNVPDNLKKIILIEPGLEYCPEPSYRMYSLKIRPARYIQVDIRERLVQMELKMKSRKEEINKCTSILQELSTQLQEIQQNIKQNRTLAENHENSKRSLCDKISELESYEYPDSNEVDLLANELKECKSKQSEFEKELQEKSMKATEAKTTLRKTKAELIEQTESLKSIEKEMNQLRSKSDEIRVKLNSLSNCFREYETKLQEIQSSAKRLNDDKQIKIQSLSELRSNAEKFGLYTTSQKTESEINEIIRQLKCKIGHRTPSNERFEDLQALLDKKTHALSKNEILFSSVKETLEMLNNSRTKRFRFIKHLKRHMAMKVMFTFQGILSSRQFTGDLSIDHNERKLTLSVVPRDHSLERTTSNTKALSGGERSFSTVAFLLSLWSCVDHPFYVLDEYDVFTDEVNREVMTQMLLRESEAKPQRQYAFLSPQDIQLESKNYIKIHRLADPKR